MTTVNQKGNNPAKLSVVVLNQVLEHRMTLYALAAGAALAAAGSPAQAKAVYTRSNFDLTLYGHNNKLAIDLNNDGTTDVTVYDICTSTTSCLFNIMGARGYGKNGVEVAMNPKYAAALKPGDEVGGGGKYERHGAMLYGTFGYSEVGAFLHQRLRFLGVSFQINGETHYGWIGFRNFKMMSAHLIGWAYETEANTPIRAGEGIRGDDSAKSVEASSLEMLAAGHERIADWRRRKAA